MTAMRWTGVFPAVTTQMRRDQSLDLEATARHIEALIDSGVQGLVMLGSLGENTLLEPEEKRSVVRMAKEVAAGRVPVLSGVAEFSTAAACRYAREMEALGADGLMVLPAMVYKAQPEEALTHFRTVARSTGLPIIVYNNPIAYYVDLTPRMFETLADEQNLVAIKESSGDVRRVTDIINQVGDRYTLFAGVDDLILESVLLGSEGWIAGAGLAFPRENQRLWELAVAGRWEEARTLYRWFMPLLHLDIPIKFVQYIKLAIQECGLGAEWVRAPRLPLEGGERARILEIIHAGMDSRPDLGSARPNHGR
ncbi:MAG TPA: dihydrodipicolinate synthase family protein [Chthonomonadaceae bacterium]|nr:dihydrodipicolinate synthase family protein [Chthonomonadaceae bacterium]